MNDYLPVVVIAVGVFFLVIAGYFVVQFLLRNRRRRRKTAYQPSFVRADKDRIKESEQLRGSGGLKERLGKEGRGRFYAFGVFIAAVFGALAVKLWSLQILGHGNYVALSTENMTAEVPVPGNRGRILDRHGNELIGNRPSVAVTGKRTLAEDSALVQRLSLVLGIPVGIIRRNLLNDSEGVQSDHTIASDVPTKAVAYIREHPTLFKGVNVEARTVRYYPYGSLGAHLLGYTGPVTEEFLASQTGDEPIPYLSGDIIGLDGAEATFEDSLRGMPGTITYKVDAAGNTAGVVDEAPPVSGDDVVLTIDAALQRETDRILMDIILKVQEAAENKNCNAGALVCIDITDGGILAASSYPTFFPSEFSRGISEELWTEMTTEESGYPLTNRVVSGLYPAASTFKAFTTLAGLKYGMIGDDTTHYCDGLWEEYGAEWAQRCWIHPAGHGTLGLEESINVSCDVFFYSVGAAFYEQWEEYTPPQTASSGSDATSGAFSGSEAAPANAAAQEATDEIVHVPIEERPNPFQDHIRTWGFGALTGVDMPGEAVGRIPDAVWKRSAFPDTPEDAQWRPGDMINMSIGQGDVLVTPLQLCNGYASIARQKIVTPHIFHQIIDSEGDVVVSYTAKEVEAQPVYEQHHRDRLLDGLKRVVVREGVFNVLPVQAAGKSGTAEVAGKDDYAWYVGFAPADDPKYCVACVIEQGGGGSATATNGVLQTLARLYDVDAGEIEIRSSHNER